MSHGLPTQPAEAFTKRRRAIAAQLGAPALLFSGVARPQNYPANIYPFRPDSHFLYLTGAWIEHAAVFVDGARDILFMPAPDPDDAVWHGPGPGWADMQRATGVSEIRDIEQLPQFLESAPAPATLPAVDSTTRFRQGRMLKRSWAEPGAPTELDERDAALGDAMVASRMIHDAAAIEQLRVAAQATVAAHTAGMAATKPGMRESDIRAAMEASLLARDMTTAYGSIVTVHGEILHSRGYDNPIAAGDLLLADVGASHCGWAGDVTRTWPVSGKFSATQRTIYEIVLASQLAAIEQVKPGARYRDIHLAAGLVLARGLVDEGILKGDPEGLVERGAHALFFVHGLGHMIGLDVHDMEDLGDRAGYAPGRQRSSQFGLCFLRLDRDLQAGMAVTIEPGFYQVPALLEPGSQLTAPFDADGSLDRTKLAQFADVRGIRIEDDVLVTAGGNEVLTRALAKQADQVEAMVGFG
ncbi:aminopeptidase P family protein [Enhygromyxa salina]|uniref:Xaa-Pro aminopeptidase n=1 Tax=Enhygromyxa salina TaxID=215803 RepID=A0A2S9YKR7_9BACT|nr:aminopeptidase P family protein [Enhygromyxa salina]PRQ05693.1 Xaa-Pro aminopeptidase [Enhygromyxa salina]